MQTEQKAGDGPTLSEELGPGTERAALDAAFPDGFEDEYFLRTAIDGFRAGQASERMRFAALCDKAWQDFAPGQTGPAFSHGFRSACALLKQAAERGPNA